LLSNGGVFLSVISFSGKLMPASASPAHSPLILSPAGPVSYIFSLTTVIVCVRLHSLYKFVADHIGITAPYNSPVVSCVCFPRNVLTEPLPRERGNRAVYLERFYQSVAPGTWLPCRCLGNVFTEPLPRERVYLAVASGKCLPIRSLGNVVSELLLWECAYRVVPLGTWLASRCPGNVFTESLPVNVFTESLPQEHV
jgi:hypothetical protein